MEYRYARFQPRLLAQDMTIGKGPSPGESFPDFELPTTDGGQIRKADLIGRPFLLYTASYT